MENRNSDIIDVNEYKNEKDMKERMNRTVKGIKLDPAVYDEKKESKQIEIPDFMKNKNQQNNVNSTTKKPKKVVKLKVFRKAMLLIGLGTTLAFASKNPYVKDAVDTVFEKIVDYDNRQFLEDLNANKEALEQERINSGIIDGGKTK